MDLGGIEVDWPANLDKNLFDHMRAAAVAHHERGGIVTFSWHPRNPLTGGDAWDVSSDHGMSTQEAGSGGDRNSAPQSSTRLSGR